MKKSRPRSTFVLPLVPLVSLALASPVASQQPLEVLWSYDTGG